MIKSMTGFGRGEYSDEKWSVTAEIRSVNHRYNDITVKMPRKYAFAEEKIKAAIREYVKRGKLDCSISVENLEGSDVNVVLNRPMAEKYIANLNAMKDEYGLAGEIDVAMVASLPDVMRIVPEEGDQEEILRVLTTAARRAAENLDEMRQIEGAKLAEDLLSRGELIKEYVGYIEERADSVPKEYRERLLQRIADLLEGTGTTAPEERIAVETAIFADKCSIAEELTRLHSHMDQMAMIIDSNAGAEGKKLDFLVQEMNREANTIGSKANDITITNWMLKIKAEVEKIREQVQNVE